MGNCLVTKLKGTVDADLPKLGEFRMKSHYVENFVANKTLFAGAGTVITVLDDNQDHYFYLEGAPANHLKTYTIPGNVDYARIWFSNGDYDISVIGKYTLTSLRFINDTVSSPNLNLEVNIDDLKYAPITEFASAGNHYVVGDIAAFAGKSMSIFSLEGTYVSGQLKSIDDITMLNDARINLKSVHALEGSLADWPSQASGALYLTNPCKITGTFADIANKTDIAQINLSSIRTIAGSINDLAKLTKLWEIAIYGNLGDYNGSIEAFVAGQIANGRTTAILNDAEHPTISLANVLKFATFGGNVLNVDGRAILTWESANKIVIYGGTAAEPTGYIYAKGATAEEIAAWEQAGKTVVVIN